MVNPRNCLPLPTSAPRSILPRVGFRSLCKSTATFFFLKKPPPQKNPDSPQKCTNTSGGRAPGATGPLCLFACSEIAPCLCCDIRCRVWLEVFQNACVLPRTFPPPSQRFRLELSLRVDGTAWLRTPCYASPAVPALSPEQRAVEEPLSRNIRQLWRFRGSSPETNKLANAAIRLAGAAKRRISVPAATAPRRPTMYFI